MVVAFEIGYRTDVPLRSVIRSKHISIQNLRRMESIIHLRMRDLFDLSQELIEQSRRDQQRREEAGRIKQQQSERPDNRQSDQQRPQRQQQHTQQQQDDEWRPEQQPRTSVPQQQQQQNYNSRQANNYSNQRAPPQQQAKQQHNRQPQYSDTKQQNNEPIYGYRMASPPETRQPTHSQPSVTSGSPVDNYARYEDNFNAPQNVPNGYERRQSPGPRSSQSMPRQSENLYNNGGYQTPADKGQSYGAPPSDNRKTINPQTQSTQVLYILNILIAFSKESLQILDFSSLILLYCLLRLMIAADANLLVIF